MVNTELLRMAEEAINSIGTKQAFIDTNALNSGGAGAGGDPSQGGAAPPQASPVQGAMGGDAGQPAPGGYPAGAGGSAPYPAGGAAPQAPPAAAPPAAAAPQPEPPKPKIDSGVAMMDFLKKIARMADAMGIPIPASDMVVTQDELTTYAMQQQQENANALKPKIDDNIVIMLMDKILTKMHDKLGLPDTGDQGGISPALQQASGDASAAGGAAGDPSAGGAGAGGIPPIQPLGKSASHINNGRGYGEMKQANASAGFSRTRDLAAAVSRVRFGN